MLIPAAVAVLFAFILGPAVTWVRRLCRSLAVAASSGLVAPLTVLVMASSPRWPAA